MWRIANYSCYRKQKEGLKQGEVASEVWDPMWYALLDFNLWVMELRIEFNMEYEAHRVWSRGWCHFCYPTQVWLLAAQKPIIWKANVNRKEKYFNPAAAKSLQLCPTLCDPIDGSPPGSSSLGFSRQEHWSGLPFPSPMHKSEKWKWSRSVVSNSSRPHGLQPTRLLHPWDFPGKSSRVGCQCLLWLQS